MGPPSLPDTQVEVGIADLNNNYSSDQTWHSTEQAYEEDHHNTAGPSASTSAAASQLHDSLQSEMEGPARKRRRLAYTELPPPTGLPQRSVQGPSQAGSTSQPLSSGNDSIFINLSSDNSDADLEPDSNLDDFFNLDDDDMNNENVDDDDDDDDDLLFVQENPIILDPQSSRTNSSHPLNTASDHLDPQATNRTTPSYLPSSSSRRHRNLTSQISTPQPQPFSLAGLEAIDLTDIDDPASLRRRAERDAQTSHERAQRQEEEARAARVAREQQKLVRDSILQQQKDEKEDDNKAEEGGEEKVKRLGSLQCVICMDRWTDITVTHCGHLFCHTCINEALIAGENQKAASRGGTHAGNKHGIQSNCPFCRTPVARVPRPERPNDRYRSIITLEFKVKKKVDIKGKGKEKVEPAEGIDDDDDVEGDDGDDDDEVGDGRDGTVAMKDVERRRRRQNGASGGHRSFAGRVG